jgi:cytochrome c6
MSGPWCGALQNNANPDPFTDNLCLIHQQSSLQCRKAAIVDRLGAMMRICSSSIGAVWLLFCVSPRTVVDALVLQNNGRSSLAKEVPVHQTGRLSAGAAAAVMTTAATIMAMVVLLPTESAVAAGEVGRGQQLFNDNCAGCHLGGANYVSPDRTLRQDALVKYGIGVESSSIRSFVTNNARHQNLVFFRVEGGKLNPQQWDDVTTFIADQAQGDKWQ